MSQGREDGYAKTTAAISGSPVSGVTYTDESSSSSQELHICRRWLIIIRRSMTSLFASLGSLLLEALTGRNLALQQLANRAGWLAIDKSGEKTAATATTKEATTTKLRDINMNQSYDNDSLIDDVELQKQQAAVIYTATTTTTGSSSSLSCAKMTKATTATSSSSAEAAAAAEPPSPAEQQQVADEAELRGAQLSDQLLREALDKVRSQSSVDSQVLEQLWSTETTMSDTQSLEPSSSAAAHQFQQSSAATTADQGVKEEDIQQSVGGSETQQVARQVDCQRLAVEETVAEPEEEEEDDKDRSDDNEQLQDQPSSESSANVEPSPANKDTDEAAVVAEDTMRIGARTDSIAADQNPAGSEQQVESQVETIDDDQHQQQQQQATSEEVGDIDDQPQQVQTGTEQGDVQLERRESADAQERQPHLAGLGHDTAQTEPQQQDQQQQQQDELDAASLPDPHGQVESDLADGQEQQTVEKEVNAEPRSWSGTSSVELANNEDDHGHIEEEEEDQEPGELLIENEIVNEQVDEEQVDEEEDEEELEEDFCGESASNSTLRRLKMDAFEDVLVCGQNRDSLEAARRLFDKLVRQQEQQVGAERLPSGGRASAPPAQQVRRAGSLHSSEPEEDSEEAGCSSAGGSSVGVAPGNGSNGSCAGEQQLYDIKIVRRSGSSVSNSNSFRQTLVCSLSPTSQLLDGSGSPASDLILSSPDAQYPIDGDEIKQCREAFRENKRLIEEQQERATKHLSQLARCQSSACCRMENNTSTNSQRAASQWNKFNRDYLEQQAQAKCSHCSLRLYPIDRMELDFTRTTLNIHRNCFKCQVCSTLLRLETYAALDAKLYCPAHIKCVTPSR